MATVAVEKSTEKRKVRESAEHLAAMRPMANYEKAKCIALYNRGVNCWCG